MYKLNVNKCKLADEIFACHHCGQYVVKWLQNKKFFFECFNRFTFITLINTEKFTGIIGYFEKYHISEYNNDKFPVTIDIK